MSKALGAGPGKRTASVALYANVNRALLATDRRPADFARAAERAVAAGFGAVKSAPFDDLIAPASLADARVGQVLDRRRWA